MDRGSPIRNIKTSSDRVIGASIFVVTLVVFWFSPVHQVTDSAYSMLLSESLLRHQTFTLDYYALSAAEVQNHWQLERVNNHIYYLYPPGSSVLSLPFVAIMNVFHISAVNADGTYKSAGEAKMETILAALLMAVLSSIFFYTARLVTPLSWSVMIALGGAFGTQVWSTASRALWSHTWEIVLVGVVIWILVAQETGKRNLEPVVLATLLAWMYFVRPTSSIFILAITLYMGVSHRSLFALYAGTGLFWLMGFVVYSWVHFGHVLPKYYIHYLERVPFRDIWTGLMGNLISPSRGLFVYCPIIFFVFYSLARYWKHVVFRGLVSLALFVVIVHLIVISTFGMWWGGECFGARMTTDLVPWFVLLAILGVQTMRKSCTESLGRPLPSLRACLAVGAFLLALSVFINARGALSWETWLWYSLPTNRDGKMLWDWRYPQFLAGLIHPPIPAEFLPPQTHIDLTQIESEKYLWYGWSAPEAAFRWTHGHEATIVFALNEITDTELRIKCAPFLAPEKVAEQRVNIDVNAHRITTLILREPGSRIYSIVLPRELLLANNVLLLGLPNAVSPIVLNIGEDQRVLGVNVEWLEFVKMNARNPR